MIKTNYMRTTILPSLYMIMVIHLLIDDTRKSLYDCIIKFLFDNTRGVYMEDMDKKKIKDVIEWCDEKDILPTRTRNSKIRLCEFLIKSLWLKNKNNTFPQKNT